MNLHRLLATRLGAGRPVRVGLIGAGKFGSMFLAQVPSTPGIEVAAIADLAPDRAREACRRVGWTDERMAATRFTDDAPAMLRAVDIEVVVEATGHAPAGIAHARRALAEGKHIVMVNVEADVLAGVALAHEAARAGVVYSLAYGDQPALICELVDWARACGFRVLAAGKGTKYLPEYHASTPATVWGYYGLTEEQARIGGMNPQMFNSFLDGTKSGIEMAAVANATGLTVPADGLGFPPCGTHELADVLGRFGGQVEVVSSLRRDGRDVVNDLRWRPFHLIGLELNISILSAALRGEATGAPTRFRSDVVATAKRDLRAGEVLDGEGGACVWGKLLPARSSLEIGGLPIGLASRVPLRRDVRSGQCVTWQDVRIDETDDAYRYRREMERLSTDHLSLRVHTGGWPTRPG
jgi:predicted homoserine dehydrogenase-like protein